MINHILKIFLLTVISSFLLYGCATTKNSLNTSDYIINAVPHQQTKFRHIWAVEYNEEFWVSGRFYIKGTSVVNIPDQVEVDLLDQSGAVIETQKVVYYTKFVAGPRNRKEARFAANFKETPPPGTTIRLSIVD